MAVPKTHFLTSGSDQLQRELVRVGSKLGLRVTVTMLEPFNDHLTASQKHTLHLQALDADPESLAPLKARVVTFLKQAHDGLTKVGRHHHFTVWLFDPRTGQSSDAQSLDALWQQYQWSLEGKDRGNGAVWFELRVHFEHL